MGKVDKLVDAESVHQIVYDDSRIRAFGLTNYPHGTWVVEEEVMHQTAPPGRNTVRSAKANVADEGVAAAVKVFSVVVATKTIFLQ